MELNSRLPVSMGNGYQNLLLELKATYSYSELDRSQDLTVLQPNKSSELLTVNGGQDE